MEGAVERQSRREENLEVKGREGNDDGPSGASCHSLFPTLRSEVDAEDRP